MAGLVRPQALQGGPAPWKFEPPRYQPAPSPWAKDPNAYTKWTQSQAAPTPPGQATVTGGVAGAGVAGGPTGTLTYEQQIDRQRRMATEDTRSQQIAELTKQMGLNGGSTTPQDVPLPDFSGMQGQQRELQSRLSELIAGRGIDVGDVSHNAEAVANRVAVERAADQQRQAEAERLGASGMTASGDSDARGAQIREQTGAQIGGFNAGLAGRLRGEAQAGAIQGAGLSLNNLQQQMSEQTAMFGSRMEQENARRLDARSKRAEQMRLLESLMAQQGN